MTVVMPGGRVKMDPNSTFTVAPVVLELMVPS